MLIIKAAQFAAECHAGQVRKYNGLPYITHPIRVAGRMATHPSATNDLVTAAFLHDVVEDCGIGLAEIREEFGQRVACHVGSLTNSPKVAGESRALKKLRDRERLSMVPDEAKVLKMIDRIDNMREVPVSSHIVATERITPSGVSVTDTLMPFAKVYGLESLALLEVLCDADPELAAEYKALAEWLIGE